MIFLLIIYIIYSIILRKLEYKSAPLMVYESDVQKYFNETLRKRRIPLIIHQTYESHNVPSIWNSTVNSVMKKNAKIFEYRRWSHTEMAEFVKEKEIEFYSKTYVKYRYEMQRIDSFRYVLMYHIGGIYLDMDNGCNRPLIDLINTLECLDKDAIYLSAFPRRQAFGVESDLLISSVNHPLYRQLINRLHLFNHNYILHFWTMLLSAGPIYVSIQERLFTRSEQSVVRLLDYSVFRPMFIYKENGFQWIRRDAHMLFYLGRKSEIIYPYFKIFLLIFILFIIIKWFRQKRQDYYSNK